MSTGERGESLSTESIERLEEDEFARAQERKAEIKRQKLRSESATILEELGQLGFHVQTVWHLRRIGTDYSSAYPLLIEHWRRGYSVQIMGWISAALSQPNILAHWDEIAELYRGEKNENLRGGLANVLTSIDLKERRAELFELIDDPRNGGTRLLLLEAFRSVPEELAVKWRKDPDFRHSRVLKRKPRKKRVAKKGVRSSGSKNTPQESLEAFLNHFVPKPQQGWAGAPKAQVDRFEKESGLPFTPFLRWYLLHMGASLVDDEQGNQRSALDLMQSLFRENEANLRERAWLPLSSSIASNGDRFFRYLDLSRPLRNDAPVRLVSESAGLDVVLFETLRESIACKIFDDYALESRPFQAQDGVIDFELSWMDDLRQVFEACGLKTLLESGDRCAIYHSDSTVVKAVGDASLEEFVKDMQVEIASTSQEELESLCEALEALEELEMDFSGEYDDDEE